MAKDIANVQDLSRGELSETKLKIDDQNLTELTALLTSSKFEKPSHSAICLVCFSICVANAVSNFSTQVDSPENIDHRLKIALDAPKRETAEARRRRGFEFRLRMSSAQRSP